jgi:hypothetical protein
MAYKDLPSIDWLRQLFRYEPETGKLFWRDSGAEAFPRAHPRGYYEGKLPGRRETWKSHRVIWALQTGAWPSQAIDHIDGNPSNNRWDNLREATLSQNQHNQRLSVANTSGIKGVSWHKTYKKWVASIRANGRKVHLGYFREKEVAAEVVRSARAELHGEYARHA